MKSKIVYFLTAHIALLSCLGTEPKIGFDLPDSASFKKYWYHQGAEITSYNLEQSRYGEIHKGSAVHIFVTERFNTQKQVKADYPDKNSASILKLNAYKRFYTGIYPYTILTSSFNSIEPENLLIPYKISTSVSEWCGHVYNQFNLKEKEYDVEVRSYFESEGDKNFKIPAEFTEDGLFSTIRLNPNLLPQGELKVIPFSSYIRLVHKPLKAYSAVANLHRTANTTEDGKELVYYSLKYPELNRELRIFFESKFPFKINKWTESYPGIKGDEVLTTTASKSRRIFSAYWGKNSNKDRELLKKLGLSPED